MLGKLKPQSGPDLNRIIQEINTFIAEGNKMPDAEQKAHGHSLGMIENMMELARVIAMPDVPEEVRYKKTLLSVRDIHQRISNNLSENLGSEIDDFDKGVSNLATYLMFRLKQAMILENPNHVAEINKTFPKFEGKPKIQPPKKTLSDSFLEGFKEALKNMPATVVGIVTASIFMDALLPSNDEGVSEDGKTVDFGYVQECEQTKFNESDCKTSWDLASQKADRGLHQFKYDSHAVCEDKHGDFSCNVDMNNTQSLTFVPIAYGWRAATYDITDQVLVEPIYPSAEVGFAYLGSGEKIAFDK